jgi:hypothetical protein
MATLKAGPGDPARTVTVLKFTTWFNGHGCRHWQSAAAVQRLVFKLKFSASGCHCQWHKASFSSQLAEGLTIKAAGPDSVVSGFWFAALI